MFADAAEKLTADSSAALQHLLLVRCLALVVIPEGNPRLFLLFLPLHHL